MPLADPPCRILMALRLSLGEGWNTWLNDPFWRWYLHDGHGAAVRSGRDRRPMDADHLYLIPPSSRVRADCRGTPTQWVAHVDMGTWLPAGLRAPHAVPAAPDQRRAFRELVPRADTDPAARLALRGLLLDRFAAVLPDQPQRVALGSADGPVAHCCSLIEHHLDQAWTVGELAVAVGLSASHLAARFRRERGISVMAWLRQRRIARAAEYLMLGDDPIDVIAERCGFANRFHFSRLFSAHIGCGPAHYRRTQRW